MQINNLESYYQQQQEELRTYLEQQLKKFQNANKEYLSAVVAKACTHAKNLLEESNKKAFERFRNSQLEIEENTKKNYPESLLGHLIKACQNDLDTSLKFNQTLFENSIKFYENQIKG